MKFIIVVLSVCLVGALALTDDQKNALKVRRDACMLETGAELEEIEKAMKGEWVDSVKMNCFAACMLKKIGMMDADGKVKEEESRAKIALTLTPEKVDEVMTKCKDLKGDSTCKTGWMIMKCYTDNRGTTIA